MAEIARAVDPPAPEEGKPPEYDAFLSYAHRDRQVTTAIQKGLHQIGRRVGQLRALRVFRDDTNLTANPDLWGKITDALDSSRFMIVVLSPQSAASHWVNEEVSYWLQRRGHEQLMLMLAEGHLAWDEKDKRFDAEQSDAAAPVLTGPGSLPAEPLYIDVSEDAPWDVRDRTFRDKLTSLAAPIHGKDKDELAGDDVREQRRFRRLRRTAVAGLAVLTVVAVVAAVIAVAQRQEAVRRLHDAVVAKLNAEGAAMLAGDTPGGDVRALQELLAANAIEANGVPILNAQIARFTTHKIVDTSSPVHQLAYSADGSRVATAQSDGTVRQWESATGKPVGSAIKGSSDGLSGVAFTPDGHQIASTSVDGTMRLWNADTGAPLNPNPPHLGSLTSVATSPDGDMIVTGGADGNIRIWDRGGHLHTTNRVFPEGTLVADVTFDRSGNLFAASGLDGSVAIFDVSTGKPHVPTILVRNLDGASASVARIAFSPDGHTIAASGDHLELFSVDTGTSIRSIQVAPSKVTVVTGVAFSPDGHRVATGRDDGALQLWDAGTGSQLGQTLTGHTSSVLGAEFSPDGRQIATVSEDGTLRLWSATIGQPMRGPDAELGQVAFSPDGRRVAALGDTTIQQWDVSSGQAVAPLHVNSPGDLRFVEGGGILTAGADGTVQLWDASTGEPASPPVHINLPQRDFHFQFAFSGDGRKVASGQMEDGTVQLWDVATGRALGPPMSANNTLYSLAFSPDGRRIAAAYNDGARLWSVDTTQPEGSVMSTPRLVPAMSVAFSRDGNTLAVGRWDGAVELWDSHTQRPLAKSPLMRHTSRVVAVAFGPGNQLGSGGEDATLRLWDTATGRPTAAAMTMSDTIAGVALSPDGRLVAVASLNGSVLLSPAITDAAQLCDKFATNMSHKQWRDWVSPAIKYITLCPGLPIAVD
jgi:WD40 repeat protein